MRHKLYLLILCLFISGCGMFAPQKDNSVFYTLGEHSYISTEEVKKQAEDVKVINLLIDEVPAYADCPYIVTKQSGNKLFFSQLNRWSEPFEDGCSRLLEEKTSEFMSDYAIVISSVHADGNMVLCDYRLSISFDDVIYNAEEKGIVLKCSWSFFDYTKKRQIIIQKYSGFAPVDEPTYNNIVDGMKSSLISLSQYISDQVKRAIVTEAITDGTVE